MTRTVYVNGDYLPETEAKVSIFDRGFLMADAVYEVTSVLGGKLIDFEGHAVRLKRSLVVHGMSVLVGTVAILSGIDLLARLTGLLVLGTAVLWWVDVARVLATQAPEA